MERKKTLDGTVSAVAAYIAVVFDIFVSADVRHHHSIQGIQAVARRTRVYLQPAAQRMGRVWQLQVFLHVQLVLDAAA